MLEHRRVEAPSQLAELAQREGELVAARRHELLRRRVGADVALQQAQLQRDRDEALLGAVVEVALEPPPLGVAGRDDALPRGLQLDHPRAQLGLQALALERDVRCGAHHLEQIGLVGEGRVVHERGDVPAVAVTYVATRPEPFSGIATGLPPAST